MEPSPQSRGHGRKCSGTNRQGNPCGNAAGKNTDHPGTGNCANHGGSTPTGKKAALREQAERTLATLDVPPVDNPLTELAKVAGQVVAWKDQMADLVSNLSSVRYSTDGGEQLRAEVALWERALDRCERFLTAMAKLNIDDRLTRIEERQIELIEYAVVTALEELGLPEEQQREARHGVSRRLRAVAAG
jgi:hypothetical protein